MSEEKTIIGENSKVKIGFLITILGGFFSFGILWADNGSTKKEMAEIKQYLIRESELNRVFREQVKTDLGEIKGRAKRSN